MESITYNNFSWSIAETNTHMKVWDCAYMENLDGRTEPEFLKLNREVRVQCATGTWLPILVLDWYVFSTDGTIRNLSNGVVVYTTPSSSPFVAWVIFWDYFIWFYQEWTNIKILSIPIDPVFWTWNFWGVVTSFWVLVDPITAISAPFSVFSWISQRNISIINNSEDILYFSIDKKVYSTSYRFMPSMVIEQSLVFESYVSGMTRDQNSINIYLRNGRKYLWGGIWYKGAEWYSDLWVSRLQKVWQAKNIDYFIASWFTGINNILYISQWQSCKQIRQAGKVLDWLATNSKFAFGTQCNNDSWMASWNNLVYFPSEEKVGAISYGIRNEVNAYWFVNEYMNNIYEDIWCLSYWTDANNSQELYLWVRDNNGNWSVLVQQYDINNSSYKYQLEWLWYTKKEINQFPQIKRSIKYFFRYELPVNTTIEIYCCKDGTNNYTLLTTLPSGQQEFIFNWWVNEWREITHKIVMKTTDNTKTPKLQSMTISIEPTKRWVSLQ